MIEGYKNKITKIKESENENHEATINFQIQYFSITRKDEYKIWAYENRFTMKDLLYALLDKKEEINKIIQLSK